MHKKYIEKTDGKLKARVEDDGYGVSLLTMRNGHQWTGQPISRDLAVLTICVLQEYLDNGIPNHDD